MPTPSECRSACVAAPQPPGIAEEREVAAARDLACETLYRLLAAALSNPDSAMSRLYDDADAARQASAAADFLRDEFGRTEIPLGFGESSAESLSIRELLDSRPADDVSAVAEYVRVFGFAGTRECSPYETEYHPNDEVFYRSQQMADVAGFFRAFGLNVSPERHDRIDHVSLELEFAAFLLMKKRLAEPNSAEAAVAQDARAKFLNDHLCWWAPSFAVALRRKASQGFYGAAANVLSALLPIERHRLGVAPPRMPLEAHRDEVIESADACEGCALARA